MNILRIATLGLLASTALAASGIAFAEATEGGAGATPTESTPAKPAGLKILTDEKQLETLSKHLSSVKIFEDRILPAIPATDGNPAQEERIESAYDQALAYIEGAAKATENFYGLPVAAAGEIDAEGNLDSSIYDGMRVRVGTLAARVPVGKVTKNGVKAITILPIPDVNAILAAEGGSEFLTKVVAKELGLVAYRNIRDANSEADLLAGMSKAPRTVAEYLAESKRAGSAGDTETFDALWRGLRDSLKEAMPALHKMLPSKVEIIKAIRSAAYAKAEYPELETAAKGSVFVKLANAVIQNAKENTTDGKAAPMDSSAIEAWLESRDTVVLTKRGPEEVDYSALKDMDFGAFGGTASPDSSNAAE